MTTATHREYEYPGQENHRFVLGLSLTTALVVLFGLITAIGLITSGLAGVGLIVFVGSVAAGGLTLLPVHSRPLGEWVPVLLRYAGRKVTGAVRWRSASPTMGSADPHAADLPPALEGVQVMAVDDGTGPVGMLADGEYPIGVLRVTGPAFTLLDQPDQENLVDAFGSFIAEHSESGAAIDRVGWIDISGAADTGAMSAYAAQHATPVDADAAASYDELVAGQRLAQARETYVVLRFDPQRMRAQVKALGGKRRGAMLAAREELMPVAGWLRSAGFRVGEPPTPAVLAAVTRGIADPAETHWLTGFDIPTDDTAEPAAHTAWPIAADESMLTYRTDSAYHRTMWAEQMPRREVAADWLVPLMAWTPDNTARRIIAAVFEPGDPEKSLRDVEHAASNDDASTTVRERAGFRIHSRHKRETAMLSRLEDKLVAGAAPVRMAVYMTVSAPNLADLEKATAAGRKAAAKSRLRMRVMVGQQSVAYTYTLPLARGLA